MKKYDFSKQELRSIPIVEGSDEIELFLIENYTVFQSIVKV